MHLRPILNALALGLVLVALKPAGASLAGPLELNASAVQLNQTDPDATRLGALAWRGGLVLSSPNRDFGGLSALRLSDDGRELLAIGDKGIWVRAQLAYDGRGHLSGAAGGRIAPLRDLQGRGVVDQPSRDAESLTRSDAGLLVGFEQDHRIWAYPDGLDAAARPVPAPAGLKRLPSNAGAESLLALADGRLLLLAEHIAQGADAHPGWLRVDGTWHRLELTETPGYKPTGAAQLPDGDLLVLVRRFTWLGGFQVKLLRVALAQVAPGARLQGRELAHFRAPWIVDNFEGIDVRRAANGETRVYLLSDDNFVGLQRTLLLMFALKG